MNPSATMKQPIPKTLFSFIGHFLKSYTSATVLYVTLALIAGFWGPFNSMLIKTLINRLPQVLDGNIAPLILPASLIVANFVVFDNLTWRGIEFLQSQFIPLVLNSIDRTLLNYTLQQSHQFFQERMTGTLSKQIFRLIDGIESILESHVSNMLRGASLLVVSFIFAYQTHPVFLGILLLWSIGFLSISLIMSRKLTRLAETQAAKESVLAGQIIDSLTHALNVKLFARRGYEIKRREPALLAYAGAYRTCEQYALRMHTFQGSLIAFMVAFALFFLLFLYKKGLVHIGDFALILGLSIETGHMMWYTTYHVDEFNKTVGKCKQSLAALTLPITIQDKPHATRLQCKQGNITLQQVHFHYKEDQPLFHNLSVHIPAGQKVGLVGPSGSGKSTFVNLILRLYEVMDGKILIDGQDIRDVTQASLHEHIAMIPQEPALFHRSLLENIRYGRLNSTDEEVIEAAKNAHAHAFIAQLPQGYASLVGERGLKLSGGQRQRIAVAIALLKNAPILILDEATSQLDSITENFIQESLLARMKDKTTLIIAHRLSTLLHMDRILVFDQGQLVEDGTHETLLARAGKYKSLWDAQVGGFLGDTSPSRP